MINCLKHLLDNPFILCSFLMIINDNKIEFDPLSHKAKNHC